MPRRCSSGTFQSPRVGHAGLQNKPSALPDPPLSDDLGSETYCEGQYQNDQTTQTFHYKPHLGSLLLIFSVVSRIYLILSDFQRKLQLDQRTLLSCVGLVKIKEFLKKIKAAGGEIIKGRHCTGGEAIQLLSGAISSEA